MKEYLPLLTLLAGIATGYLLSKGKKKNESSEYHERPKREDRLNDVVPMNEEKIE